MNEYKFGPFLGVSNRRADTEMHVSTRQVQGDYLRYALNVDVDNAGKLRLRTGAELLQSMTGAHSFFKTGEDSGLIVRDGVLYSVTLQSYSETIVKMLTSNAAMSYVSTTVGVLYSNGTDSGRILSGTYYPLALPTPDSPDLGATAGNLQKGWYQVCVSYYNASTGEEGGVSPSGNIQLGSTGGIQVTLPGATAGATHTNVYLSGANGEVPQLAATLDASTTTTTLAALATGREAYHKYIQPLPAGQLRMINGRLCSFVGNKLYIGEPYRYGYYDPVAGYIPFASDICTVIGNQQGTYVGTTDKTHFIPGDIGNVQDAISDVLPYGSVRGTEFVVENESKVGWFGAKGLVLANTQGEVQAVMSDNVDVDAPASGVSYIIDEDECRRVISCDWSINLSNLAATQYDAWDFTSLSCGYGTKADGLYKLGGSEEGISWEADFGTCDLGSDGKKHLSVAYVGTDCTERMWVTVTTPDGDDFEYPQRNYEHALARYRFDLGRGLRESWFSLCLSGIGATKQFHITDVKFVLGVSHRRLG